MLTITNDAMKICHDTIVQLSNSQSESKCLRLQKDEDAGLTMIFDTPRKTDEIIKHEGRDIIAVPEQFIAFCSNKTLAIDEQGKLILS